MFIPLSLYIHIPWCIRKCPYCDFYSVPINPHNLNEAQYIHALIQDFEYDLQMVEQKTLVSIFFGGGTPSLLAPKSIEYLLNEIHKRTAFQSDIEISLEANPQTFEQQRFADFRLAGINRLSVGIQSFQDNQLKRLGRIHRSSEAKKAISIAQSAGFDNFNLDLMYGLPLQSIEEAYDDLETAISFQPPHLSWYQLTLEPSTPFGEHPPKVPSEDELWTIQNEGQSLLRKTGYHHYEISAYSKPNHRCLHNMNYWQFGDYIGIGAGAHEKITTDDHKQITRYCKTTDIKDYISNRFRTKEKKVISKQELPLEFMMNALRLTDGVPTYLFHERTGMGIEDISPLLKEARQRDLIDKDEKIIKTTPLGQRFLNDCLEIFIAH